MQKTPGMNKYAIKQALQLMQTHINALNERDASLLQKTLHFPHHRLSGTTWKTWETPERYFEDFLKRAGDNWKRSTFEDIRVVDSSENKVHLDAEIRRYDSNDILISQFRSLWVIVEIDGISVSYTHLTLPTILLV